MIWDSYSYSGSDYLCRWMLYIINKNRNGHDQKQINDLVSYLKDHIRKYGGLPRPMEIHESTGISLKFVKELFPSMANDGLFGALCVNHEDLFVCLP